MRLFRVVSGKCDPDLVLAVALEAELGIPVESWPTLRGPVQRLLELRGMAA